MRWQQLEHPLSHLTWWGWAAGCLLLPVLFHHQLLWQWPKSSCCPMASAVLPCCFFMLPASGLCRSCCPNNILGHLSGWDMCRDGWLCRARGGCSCRKDGKGPMGGSTLLPSGEGRARPVCPALLSTPEAGLKLWLLSGRVKRPSRQKGVAFHPAFSAFPFLFPEWIFSHIPTAFVFRFVLLFHTGGNKCAQAVV